MQTQSQPEHVTQDNAAIPAIEAGEGGLTIKSFTRVYDIGVTATYAEIAAGRLVAKKRGKRTLITRASARAWFDSLPQKSAATVAA